MSKRMEFSKATRGGGWKTLEARTSAVEEFAEREGMDFKEAATLFAGELGEYADEFHGVLEIYWRDRFGWTLDKQIEAWALKRSPGSFRRARRRHRGPREDSTTVIGWLTTPS